MAGVPIDTTRAPVAYGRRAIPRLFEEVQLPEVTTRLRALTSLCTLMHDPDEVYQTIRGGFSEQLEVLLNDEDPMVRMKTCELLHLMTNHSVGRRALLASSLLPPLSQLLDDPSPSCRTNVHRVLNNMALLPADAAALLPLVPLLMTKLREDAEEEEAEQADSEKEEDEEEEREEEEAESLLISTLTCCSRLDPHPALDADGVTLLGRKLAHRSVGVRKAAAAAMMALSVPEVGKRRLCEEAVLPALVSLLRDNDVEVQANAAGAIMNTVIITTGKMQCLDLDVIAVLLELVSKQREEEEEEEKEEKLAEEMRRRRKALVIYCLRALTSLAEAPAGRQMLLEQLPVLQRRSEAPEEDPEVRGAARTAVKVITWTP